MVPGDVCQVSGFTLGRNGDVWPDPYTYKPERHLTRGKDGVWVHKTHSEFKFFCFNAGPRFCLGKRFAYLEAVMTMVRILRRFTFTLEDEETTYQLGLTLVPKGGMYVRVGEAEDQGSEV